MDKELSYGNELWDCITLLEKTSLRRTSNMKSFKEFMTNFK